MQEAFTYARDGRFNRREWQDESIEENVFELESLRPLRLCDYIS